VTALTLATKSAQWTRAHSHRKMLEQRWFHTDLEPTKSLFQNALPVSRYFATLCGRRVGVPLCLRYFFPILWKFGPVRKIPQPSQKVAALVTLFWLSGNQRA
jgi:hypothetical protein